MIDTLEKNDISIVLINMRIPESNGYDLAKKAKEYNPPIIAITAHAFKFHKEKCLEVCDDYLDMPYRVNTLVEILNKYLSNDYKNK